MISEDLATLQGQNGPINVPDRLNLSSGRNDTNLTLKSGTDFNTNMAEFYTADGTRRSRLDAQGRFWNEFSSPWDDLLVPLSTAKAVGASPNDPDWVDISVSGGTAYGWSFPQNKDTWLAFTAQIPHAWKEGSTIYPHVHWYPTTNAAGNVVWLLQFMSATIGGVFPSAPNYSQASIPASGSAARVHKVSAFPTFDATGYKISSIISGIIRRFGTSGSDTYEDPVIGLHIDFHIEIDSLGSRAEFLK
jgi:hypothetical protein